jgi:M6 family metalloprotease-like protein
MRRIKNLSKSLAATIAAFLCLAGAAHSGSEHLLRLGDKQVLAPAEKATQPNAQPGFRSGVSIRNLLELKRETPFSLPRFSKLTPVQTNTLKILAIRVEFEEEVPDDPRTTGNGLFDMRTQDEFFEQEGHLIDPSPHDTLFFDKHIEALHNYWWTVSNGQLALEGEVFPKAENLAYRLSYPMVHYGAPDSSLGVKVEMLRQFFHDSFNLADSLSLNEDPQVYGIDFSKYDCFVIFHAGSDLQSDLGELVSPTPGDLFTGYIRLGDTVWVNGGTFPITDGMFMPETKSQDNRVSALNGVMAHEFGHQLGLPDIYNSDNFVTQVGDFALMDNNAQNVGVDVGYGVYVSGVLPVYPCAWSRAYLGFIEPREITGRNLKLRAAERLAGDVQMIKIPISPQEYFLLENRKEDADNDGFSGLRADVTTNVILGPVDADRNYNREYDWLLPGSGILIFHVDESVAYLDYDGDGLNNFWDNQLQAVPDRRFLTLAEADGIVDFGGNYYTGFGQREDMFYQGNNTQFTPRTFPSSKSVNKSDTHIWVTGISYADTVMILNVFRDWSQQGFPRAFTPVVGIGSLVFGPGTANVYASSGEFIHGWSGEGNNVISLSMDSLLVMSFDSTIISYPLAIFAAADEYFVGSPALGDLDGDDTSEVVAATVSGKVYAWHPYDRNFDGRADVVDGFPVDLNGSISVAPIVADFDSLSSTLEIFVATKAPSPRTVVISHDGTIIHSSLSEGPVVALTTTGDYRANFSLRDGSVSQEICTWNMYDDVSPGCVPGFDESGPVVAGDIDRDGDVDATFCSCTGPCYLNALDLKLGGSSLSVSLEFDPTSGPVLGDIDQDGYLEIILTSSDKVYAYNFNGALVSDFPVTLSLPGGSTDLIESPPIIGDADGDGYPDIILGTKDGRIVACNKNGKMVNGFPLAVGGPVASSPVMMNLDEDSDAELLVAADDGFVYAWDLPGTYDERDIPWPMYGYDAGHTNYFPSEKLPEIPPLAGDLIPKKKAFNYPNPAGSETVIRYFLTDDAQVGIRIYDLSGMLVDEFPGPGVGRTYNEKTWNCSRYASGVYLCRVEAKSADENQVVFFKMALVK